MAEKDLMQPRYKVIADYPLSDKYFKVGDVFTWDEVYQCYQTDGIHGSQMHKATIERYPQIFKKLMWWEERSKEEMPEYVKWNEGSASITEDGKRDELIIKIIEYVTMTNETFARWGETMFESINMYYLDPATEQEFLNQKS